MTRTLNCLVTGANGFVGSGVLERMKSEGERVVGAVRGGRSAAGYAASPALGPDADWRPLLAGIDCVIHCAARVHVPDDRSAARAGAFHVENAEGTLALARQAAAAGVRRFVHVSSVKVHGEATAAGRRFTEADPPAPRGAYAASKAAAEAALMAVAAETGMEYVVVRPPLVYGPGVKGNFRSLMRWLERGLPLPLGALGGNRRSLVALDNLVDLVATCATHPAAANQVFLAGDGEDLSTAELARRLGAAIGVSARLVAIPPALLALGASVAGRRATARQLCGNLQVDISKAWELLGWRPIIDVDEGLRRAADGRATMSASLSGVGPAVRPSAARSERR